MAESSTSFKPGESGNPKGRPKKGESLTELMREFLNTKSDNGVELKHEFIEKVLELAMAKGDTACIKLIWNYLEGMPKETIRQEFDEMPEININIVDVNRPKPS